MDFVLLIFQVNITERYHAMVVKDFFDEAWEKTPHMSVDIKTTVLSIKTNEINVDTVGGSMYDKIFR